jgi:phage baseplate assembly protein W
MARANVSNLIINPFAPPPKAVQTPLVSTGNIYDPLVPRAMAVANNDDIQEAIENLRQRLQGEQYAQKHFGRLELQPAALVDINIDIQRLLETPHIAKNIIELFDPRIMQPLNVIYIKSTGRYSAWEGQQSGTAFALMMHFGLISEDTLIQCKVVDDDLEVPGSDLVGEAVGNLGFRCINYKGRKEPDLFYIFRSMVNGVRLYNSTLTEDLQAKAQMFVKRIPRDQPFIILMEAEIKKFLAELTVQVDQLKKIIGE